MRFVYRCTRCLGVACIVPRLYAPDERAFNIDVSSRDCRCPVQPHADGTTEGHYSEEATLLVTPAPPFVH